MAEILGYLTERDMSASMKKQEGGVAPYNDMVKLSNRIGIIESKKIIVPQLTNLDSNGNYTTVTLINGETSLSLLKSEANNYNTTTKQFQTYTLTFYETDGETIEDVYTITPILDSDNNIINMGVVKL